MCEIHEGRNALDWKDPILDRSILNYKQAAAKTLIEACFGIDTKNYINDGSSWKVEVYGSDVVIHFKFIMEFLLVLMGLDEFSPNWISNQLRNARVEAELDGVDEVSSAAMFKVLLKGPKAQFKNIPISFFSPINNEEVKRISSIFDDVRNKEVRGMRKYLTEAFLTLCEGPKYDEIEALRVFSRKGQKNATHYSFQKDKQDIFWQFRKAFLEKDSTDCIGCPREAQLIQQAAEEYDNEGAAHLKTFKLWIVCRDIEQKQFEENLAEFKVIEGYEEIKWYFDDENGFFKEYQKEINQDRDYFKERYGRFGSTELLIKFLGTMAKRRGGFIGASKKLPAKMRISEFAEEMFIDLLAHAIIKEAIKG